MSQFFTRPERGSRLFQLAAINPVPAAPTQLTSVGPISSALLQAPKTNTLGVEVHPPGGVSGNGIILYPGDSIQIKIDDGFKIAVNDPAASGVQTLRVMYID